MIEENEFAEPSEKPRPKKISTKNPIERVLIYRKDENTDIGNFHKSTIGEPLEQRLPEFVKRMYGGGDYRVDFRGGAKNSFAGGTSFSISDDEPNVESTRQITDVAPDYTPDFDEPEFDINAEIDRRVELALQRLGIERKETAETSTNGETLAFQMLREMHKQSEKNQQQNEKSFLQGIELAKSLVQTQQQQPDPATLMLSMLKGTLEVQRGVRELSEEIAPNDSGGGSSLLADGAKLISSIGQSAPTLIPLLGGLLGGGAPKTPIRPAKPQTAPTANGNGQIGGIADLANKIKAKEVNKNGK